MHKNYHFVVLVLCAALFSACNQAPAAATNPTAISTNNDKTSPTAVPTEKVTANEAKQADPAAYPASDQPGTGAGSSYPAPEQPAAPAEQISYPAPDSASGNIPAIPPTSRYGIPEVDRILDIFLSPKIADLPAVIAYQKYPCAKSTAASAQPKCVEGEVEGKEVEVLPVIGQPQGFLRQDPGALTDLPGQVSLVGVYQVQPSYQSEQYYPAGAYGLLFQRNADKTKLVNVHITANGIVRVDYIDKAPLPGENDADLYLKPK